MNESYRLLHSNTDRLFSKQELIEIGDKLNHWQWDERLGPSPHGWDSMPNIAKSFTGRWRPFRKTSPNKYDTMRPLVREINWYVSTYDFLKFHWLHNLGKTEQEFIEWYLGRLGDAVLQPWRIRNG